ncbi:hypothetical protein KTS45_13445 [Halomicroarcula limicola]|uniref:Nucleotide-diphospho-sugar transferase domain-containing protein n=1 Tax=Haloarcula limicola TaxID=1429915 RepID=A0A8J7YC78_9EURY|nr:hypothetical protein [Halomicroarcula limicola]MBV0925204.1 hypothetical protein [Halomicroarcula limicola]
MERGILYIAKGDEFVQEAIISAQRTKSVMPDCPITLVADHDPTEDCFDRVLLDESPFLKRDKAAAMQRTPYERTLYLDTDIYLEQPVWELFDILDDFDVAIRMAREMAHIPTGGSTTVDGVPPGVPEFNGGVIAYRDTETVMEMLADWASRCLPEHEWDQRTLRPALYHSDVRLCPIQNRYNCMYRFDNKVVGEIKVFHGPLIDRERNSIDTNTAREKLNTTEGFRIHRNYLNTLFVDPPLPLTTKARISVRRFYELFREQGLRETIRRTLQYFSTS